MGHSDRFRRGHHRTFDLSGPEQTLILTTVLGIAGAFLVTFIGQAIGWYRLDQGAGIVGAVIGAFIVLFVWNRPVVRHAISDPGAGPRY